MNERRITTILSRLIGAETGAVERECKIDPIHHGGSDREFLRVSFSGKHYILMLHSGSKEEFLSYIEVNGFLAENGLHVPEILSLSKRSRAILLEDLGDVHLDDVLKKSDAGAIEYYYRKCLGLLTTLQTKVTERMYEEDFLKEKIFSKEKLLSETEYFIKEFLEGYCELNPPVGMDEERRYLAELLSSERRVFMHRDFQSRNIMVKGNELYLIDFQTAHRGPWAYDAASLLKDAYHPIDRDTRERLAMEFHLLLRENGIFRERRFDDFHRTITLAGIQRNMQALAAFAKLGSRMGKRRFLASIPHGLMLLKEGLEETPELKYHGKMLEAVMEKLGL